MIKKIEVVLKIEKKKFFSSVFQHGEKAKKRAFCDFKDHFDLFDHQTTLKYIARILYDFCILGILKKLINSSKSAKQVGIL